MPLLDTLHQAAGAIPVINTHCHHQESDFFKGMHLRRLLERSYVSWTAPVPEPESETPLEKEWFDRVRYNSYFLSLQKGLQALYGLDVPLSVSSWDIYDRALREAHKDDGWHLTVLRERCRYQRIIQDSYWDPGSAPADEMFAPAFRVNMFFFFHDTLVCDHNGNNALQVHDICEPFSTLSDYLAFLYGTLRERKKDCVALKCAIAYDRDLAFSDEISSDADLCYSRLVSGNPKTDDLMRVQNHVFFRMCEMAGELGMPMQCHVGLGILDRTRAIHLLEVIEANSDTKFVLFHGSYPYLEDVYALCHNFQNVYADLCWLPLISPSAAERFVNEYIEVGGGATLTWGCDTWCSEESLGALLSAREILCKVAAEKIQSGYFREADGLDFLRGVFHDNAKAIYDL